MRSHFSFWALVVALCAASVFAPQAARADIDLEFTALVGSGVDTGNASNNPYALQLGGAAELIISGWVFGVRATRSFGTNSGGSDHVNDLRSIGGDLGYEWELWLLHIGPRLGVGQVSEHNGDLKAPYLDPGLVAEIEVGWFVVGADARYRVAIKDTVANGFLVYGKIGLRF
ncbi:MAG: hypothetical protein QM778_26460 [Myxococcales bacterium]